MGCWEVDPTGVTGGEGEGKAGVTPGFLVRTTEWVMVPFPGHCGAGTGFRGQYTVKYSFRTKTPS